MPKEERIEEVSKMSESEVREELLKFRARQLNQARKVENAWKKANEWLNSRVDLTASEIDLTPVVEYILD